MYAFVDRGDLADVLNTFDVSSPDTPSGKRCETTVPQQALFLMNSPLVIEQVRRVVNREACQGASLDPDRVRWLYELYFQRPPTDEEIRVGLEDTAHRVAGVRPRDAPHQRSRIRELKGPGLQE